MAQATRPAGPLEGPRARQTGPIQVTWAKCHALNGGSKGNLCCDFASTSKDLVWGLGVPSQTLWEMQRQDIQNAGKQPTQRSNRALGGFERAFLSPQSLRWSLTCANWRTCCLPKWPSQKDQKYLRSRSLAGLLSGFEPSERRHLPAPTCGSCTPRFPSSGREVTLPPCMIEPRPDFQTRDGHWMKPKANVDSGPTCLSDEFREAFRVPPATGLEGSREDRQNHLDSLAQRPWKEAGQLTSRGSKRRQTSPEKETRTYVLLFAKTQTKWEKRETERVKHAGQKTSSQTSWFPETKLISAAGLINLSGIAED